MKAMINAKAVGMDDLSVELLKDAAIAVLHKKGDKTERGNYRSISLVSHAGKVLLKVVARILSAYCKAKVLLPKEQCGVRPDRSTTDMVFVVRMLQENGRKAGVSLLMCFIDIKRHTIPLTIPSCGRYSLAPEYDRR